ncbi:MAG: cellulase family glycosylhydrolase [Oscillochloridaceae bacterium umkhey_bin13]
MMTHTAWRALAALILLSLGLSLAPVVAAQPRSAVAPLHPITPAAGQLWLLGQPFEVRGLNYIHYTGSPVGCPELHFGADPTCPWDRAAIDADMDRLAGLGVNTIRVFLNYYVFGGARAQDPNYRMDLALAHLDELLASASRRGIYVMPVLLVKFPQDQLNPAGFDQAFELHVRPVVRHLAARPGIIAWDLFNEPDLGSPIDGRCWDWDNGDFPLCLTLANQRLAFMQRLSNEVRQLDPGRPITIGLGFAKNYFRPLAAEQRLADMVDIYTFHYYDDDPFDSGRYAQHWYYGKGLPTDLRRSISELHNLGQGKPVIITELGFPLAPEGRRSLAEVQRDLRLSLNTSREAGARGVMLWPFERDLNLIVGDLFTAGR